MDRSVHLWAFDEFIFCGRGMQVEYEEALNAQTLEL
jgi:hypothetical protein